MIVGAGRSIGNLHSASTGSSRSSGRPSGSTTRPSSCGADRHLQHRARAADTRAGFDGGSVVEQHDADQVSIQRVREAGCAAFEMQQFIEHCSRADPRRRRCRRRNARRARRLLHPARFRSARAQHAAREPDIGVLVSWLFHASFSKEALIRARSCRKLLRTNMCAASSSRPAISAGSTRTSRATGQLRHRGQRCAAGLEFLRRQRARRVSLSASAVDAQVCARLARVIAQVPRRPRR